MVLNLHVRVFNCVDVNMSVIVPLLGVYCFGFFMKLRGWWQNGAQGDR
jgi:ABC-type multidrug transport system permease subunit